MFEKVQESAGELAKQCFGLPWGYYFSASDLRTKVEQSGILND